MSIEMPKFDFSPRQNPLTNLHQKPHALLRYGLNTTGKILCDRFRGLYFQNTWFCSAISCT